MKPQSDYVASRCNYVYMCIIAADGTFETGPRGWDCVRSAAGTYVITHNIGNQVYAPIPRAIAASDFLINATVEALTENTITVGVYNATAKIDNRITLTILVG